MRVRAARTLLRAALSVRRRSVVAMAAPLRFCDIGANLCDPMFAGEYRGSKSHDPDLPAVLDRAWAAGVHKIVITAGSVDEARDALELAKTDDRLFCTAGVHPTRASSLDVAALRAVIADGVAAGKCVAVGETGLDYARLSFCDAPTQRAAFAAQLEVAAEVKLPLFLHLRRAEEGDEGGAAAGDAVTDFCTAVAAAPPLPAGGVVHSFDGSEADLNAVLNLGGGDGGTPPLFIGINGCSLKTDANLSVVSSHLPLARLLLETDAPWCDLRPSHASAAHAPPAPRAVDRKKWTPGAMVKTRNEPCRVADVAVVIASLKGVDVRDVADAAWANSEALFFGGGRGG